MGQGAARSCLLGCWTLRGGPTRKILGGREKKRKGHLGKGVFFFGQNEKNNLDSRGAAKRGLLALSLGKRLRGPNGNVKLPVLKKMEANESGICRCWNGRGLQWWCFQR